VPNPILRRAAIGVVALFSLSLAACEAPFEGGVDAGSPASQVTPSPTASTAPAPRPTTAAATRPTTAPTTRPTTAPTTPTVRPSATPTTHVPTPPPTSEPRQPGVPPGTKLTPRHGDLTITRAGTVVSNLEIFGTVSIKAPNVTIKNSRIRAQQPKSTGVVNSKAAGVVIQDTEILSDHHNSDINGVMGWGFTLDRVNIHHVVDHVHIHGAGQVTIKDSWLHSNTHFEKDPNWGGKPSHDDNVQIVSGSDIRIEGSTIEGAHNAAIMIGQNAGKITNLTLSRNIIGGGACSVNIAEKSRGPLTSVTISDNAFTRTQTKHEGCAVISPPTSKPAMARNFWMESGEAVALSRG
jgi:hypothetical protein